METVDFTFKISDGFTETSYTLPLPDHYSIHSVIGYICGSFGIPIPKSNVSSDIPKN